MPRAEDLLLNWLMRLPIDVDPADAARHILAEIPARPDDTVLQSRLRGFLLALSRLRPPDKERSASG